jgi:hypothetical protein
MAEGKERSDQLSDPKVIALAVGLPTAASITMLPHVRCLRGSRRRDPVSEEAVVAIRTAYEQEGELLAAVEVRRWFPGITDNAEARACARTIAGWNR